MLGLSGRTAVRASGAPWTVSAQGRTLLAMCLAVLMVQLDTTIVNLSLRPIQAGLGGDVASLQWIADAYNVAYASLILSGGTLGDLYGRRRLFVAGVAMFAVASVACGLAPDTSALIAGRVAAGVGAAVALPGSLSILRVAYPEPRARAHAVSIWAAVNAVAIALGPTLGGLLVDTIGWRSIFFVVVPVAVAALALAPSVRESADPRGRRLDLPGQVAAAGGLGLLAFATIQGNALGWTAWPIVASYLGGAACLVALVAVERRAPSPMVPLGVFARPAFTASILVASLMTFGMYGLLFLLPQYLQVVLGRSGARAGLELMPMGIVFAATSPLAGRLATAGGPRRLIAGGMALTGLGLLTFQLVAVDGGDGPVMVGLVLLGLALGLVTGPLLAVAVASIPSSRAGMAAGLVNVGRMVGAVLGVAVLGTIFAGVSGGQTRPDAFLAGFHVALACGALAACAGSVLAWRLIDDTALQLGGTSHARS
jgi:MFS transporter, DHA2 family, methylenomycin A resistance protein